MKIAFPTNNQTTIATHIGLAKGFLIIDTDTKESYFIPNPIREEIKGVDLKNAKEGERGLGVGRIVPEILAREGVDVFIANEFGEGMFYNLQRVGIKPFETETKDIQEALKEVEMKNINELERSYGFIRGLGRGFGYGMGYGCRRRFNRGLGRGFRKRFSFRD